MRHEEFSVKVHKVRSENGKQVAHCAPGGEQPVSMYMHRELPHSSGMPRGSRILLFKHIQLAVEFYLVKQKVFLNSLDDGYVAYIYHKHYLHRFFIFRETP